MNSPLQKPRTIEKPWGNELWIADGVRTPYALKRILFKAGKRSSLQVHKFKFETNYVLEGTGVFQIWLEPFDCDSFTANNIPQDELDKILSRVTEVELKPGDVIDVKPGQIHRITAVTDLTFIEASTVELDDVIRLADDANRGNGKIETEHGH
jgi:quercetin dioxygenase-like cupin family protein